MTIANLGEETGGDAISVEVDVSKVADMEGMIKTAVDTYGKLNILFSHAGQPGPYQLEQVTEKEWTDCVNVNVKGGFFATKFAVPEMRKTGGGSIIFTSSMSGVRGSALSPTYSFVKGGLVVMTMALASLLGPDSIRVNCICPGSVEPPMLPRFYGPRTPEEVKTVLEQRMAKLIPLGRVAQPEEIAYAALYLASDEASYVTGISLTVDGGRTGRS